MSKTILRSRTIQAFIVGAVLLSLLFAACAPPMVDADGKPPAGSPTHEGIDIADVDILIMESFPVQVAVIVRGHLRDGCTEIDAIRQSFDPETNTFSVDITTVRDADAICTQALAPFEERVSLDVHGLAAGPYTVNVNGVVATFTVDVDNVLDREDDEAAPSEPVLPVDGSVTRGIADVEEIDVLIPDSPPAQLAVIIRGHLRDGCTEIDAIRQSFDPDTDTFSIDITTVRDDDALCTLALVPFEERVSLDAGPLPAGTYTVNVNGITDSFTLDRQTALPVDDDEPVPSPDPSVTYGTADVEEIHVRIRESDPVQVAVDIRGYLRDGCTEVHAIRQRFDAATDTFYVDITTARPTDAICILVLQELEERVTLDVAGLPGGTYTVDVNGVTDTFTLDG